MKNLHVLPTDHPSRLRYNIKTRIWELNEFHKYHTDIKSTHNIYITSDEEIKKGNYWIYVCPINGIDYGDDNNPIVKNNLNSTWFEKLHDKNNYKRVILTTDQDLIADGVEQILEDTLLKIVEHINSGNYTISINESTSLYSNKKSENNKIEDYVGKAWCITTDNGTVISRRNGKVIISGNSCEGVLNAGTMKLANLDTIFSNGSVVTDGKFGKVSSHGNIFEL